MVLWDAIDSRGFEGSNDTPFLRGVSPVPSRFAKRKNKFTPSGRSLSEMALRSQLRRGATELDNKNYAHYNAYS